MGWRNRASAALQTDGRMIVLAGENGRGKTNLLEAVYLLATLRSFRESRAARLVLEGATAARVEGLTRGDNGDRTLAWTWENGERTLTLDGGPGSLSAWFECLRVVLFCPEQVAIVRGDPEQRRQFLDRAVFTARPTFLELARDYRRVVQQKGALLRSGRASASELDTWDERLALLGAKVTHQRQALIDELRAPVAEVGAEIAGGEPIELRLKGSGGEPAEEPVLAERLRAAIARARAEELRTHQVLVGPHRDDLEIRLSGRLARRYASQGQARTVVLALKLGELEAARRRRQVPLFLLDDLTSELDQGRRERLVSHLLSLDNQVWITTTDAAYLGRLASETLLFQVSDSAVSG